MNDQGKEVASQIEKDPPVNQNDLEHSKLYYLARTTPILKFLVPDLIVQISAEDDINLQFPREADDGDDTRILINYRNARGNSVLFKVNDSQRLRREFTIDHFLAGHHKTLDATNLPADPSAQIDMVILTALNEAVLTTLGFNDQNPSQKTKDLSMIVLQSIVAILFDDALDVIIAINDRADGQNGEKQDPTIVGMWAVKTRQFEISGITPEVKETDA